MQECVTIVVVGDPGVGKTSLITTVVTSDFQEKVPPKIPPVLIPRKKQGSRTEIIDTSSKPADQHKVDEDIKRADFICIAYDVNKLKTKESVMEHWIPRIHKLRGKVPLALIGTKTDIRDVVEKKRTWEELENAMMPIMNEHDDIEYVLECSVKDKSSIESIDELFWYAQQYVLYPRMPLCDADLNFTIELVNVLKRLFKLIDSNKDGYLDNDDLRSFQKICFGEDLDEDSVEGIKQTIATNDPTATSERGLTEHGFISLFHLILERGRRETIWTILRHFGYDNNLKLHESYSQPSLNIPNGERVELSDSGIKFLTRLFIHYSKSNNEHVLTRHQLNRIFLLIPDYPTHPWRPFHFPECCVTHTSSEDEDGEDGDIPDDKSVSSVSTTTASLSSDFDYEEQYEAITLKTWLAMWSLLTLYDYKTTMKYLSYLGYEGNGSAPRTHFRDKEFISPISQAVTITKLNHKNRDRSIFLAYVFGSIGSGKHSVLRRFLNKPQEFDEYGISQPPEDQDRNIYSRNRNWNQGKPIDSRFAINEIDNKQYLVLEIPESEVETTQSEAPVGDCDAALFLYDFSSYKSFVYAVERFKAFKQIKSNRTKPCLFIATKSDLTQFALPQSPKRALNAEQFCSRNKLHPPIKISVKNNHMGKIFALTLDAIRENKRIPVPNGLLSGVTKILKWSSAAILLALMGHVVWVTCEYYYEHKKLTGITLNHFILWKQPLSWKFFIPRNSTIESANPNSGGKKKTHSNIHKKLE